MPPRQARLACRTHFGRPNRYKTLPARSPRGSNRYKTLPAPPKWPISARFTPAGRTLYRSHHQQVEQGELCTARGDDAGTKLSPLAALAGRTGTKLSPHPQNGPFQHVLRQQGELYTACATNKPSRENFVPHAGPMPVQNSPSSQPSGRHRYKTPPAPPKWPISARFTPAGRTLYRLRHQQTEQGELCTARGADAGTKLSQLAAQRATPVQNSPSTPKMAHFSTFYASRENFIPLPPPTGRAGRKKSRTNTPPHPPTRPSPNFACNSIE